MPTRAGSHQFPYAATKTWLTASVGMSGRHDPRVDLKRIRFNSDGGGDQNETAMKIPLLFGAAIASEPRAPRDGYPVLRCRRVGTGRGRCVVDDSQPPGGIGRTVQDGVRRYRCADQAS